MAVTLAKRARRPQSVQLRKLSRDSASAAVTKPQPSRHSLSRLGCEPVVQRRLGFEYELLALVDINGRPPPEKTVLGTYNHVELQVDHNGDVEGDTPTAPEAANFNVPMPAPHLPLALGAYDLPATWERRVGQTPGQAPVADERTALPWERLRPANWIAATQLDRFRRPGQPNNTNLNNAALPAIDTAIPLYAQDAENWNPAAAIVQLDAIIAAVDAWINTNNARPPDPSFFDLAAKRLRRRYDEAVTLMASVRTAAFVHKAFWQANPDPPQGLIPLYRPRPVGPAPPAAWSTRHRFAGGGTAKYASILEIVTAAYEPETAPGRADLLRDVGEAVALAAAIEAGTNNFANRIAFNTIGGVAVAAGTHVGNANPTRNPQSTDASIQSTFGVDLAQIPSLIKTFVGQGVQSLFALKHQGDQPPPPGPLSLLQDPVLRAHEQLALAVTDATAIVNQIKAQPAFGPLAPAPSFVNLRGLITLVCQYLRMGRYHGAGSLDKNLTDLLSRTNLSHIYMNAVPAGEKTWINANPANLTFVVNQIFARTGRNPASTIFNDPAESLVRGIQCSAFVRNVFTAGDDGVTGTLGGFQRRPVEDIDPAGNRADVPHRTGPVFELRNMVPKDLAQGERFPRAQWVPLATYLARVMELLNARTEANAQTDVRVRQNPAPNVSPEAHTW